MITDAILDPLLAVARWLVDLLPTAELVGVTAQPTAGIVGLLAKVNSILPIGPAITLAVALLSALATFVAIRAVLTVWHIVWP